MLAQRYELREKELQYRLDSSDEAHHRSTHELREMLVAQHRIGTRYLPLSEMARMPVVMWLCVYLGGEKSQRH